MALNAYKGWKEETGIRQGGGGGGGGGVLHLSVAEAEDFKQQRKDPEIQTKFLKMKTCPL